MFLRLKNLVNIGASFFFRWFNYIFIVFYYLLLTGKNPFSERNLISNLEPYPDGLYYLLPAWRFLKFGEFQMKDNFISMDQIIPPGYGILNLPIFYLFNDPRSFYFTNLILGILSVIYFYKICSMIITPSRLKNLYSLFATFFFVSNYYFYSLASLPMAENPLVFLYIYLLYSYLRKNSNLDILKISIILAYTLFVKLASFPMFVAFGLCFLLKYIQEGSRTKNWAQVKRFLLYSFLFNLLIVFYYYFNRLYTNDFAIKMNYVAFSTKYFMPNFLFYFNTLFGGKTQFLWNYYPAFFQAVSIISVLGFFFAQKRKSYFILSLSSIVFTVLFFSFLWGNDARYVFHLWIFIVLNAIYALSYVFKNTSIKIQSIILVFLFAIFLFTKLFNQNNLTNIISIKRQVGLNLKHAERPWNYISVKTIESFFGENKSDNAVLFTVLPSYYFFLVSNKIDYEILPFTKDVEFYFFSGSWISKIDQFRIEELIDNNLKNGKSVYITNAYITNLASWVRGYENLKAKYVFKLEREGCLGSCNIYSISK